MVKSKKLNEWRCIYEEIPKLFITPKSIMLCNDIVTVIADSKEIFVNFKNGDNISIEYNINLHILEKIYYTKELSHNDRVMLNLILESILYTLRSYTLSKLKELI